MGIDQGGSSWLAFGQLGQLSVLSGMPSESASAIGVGVGDVVGAAPTVSVEVIESPAAKTAPAKSAPNRASVTTAAVSGVIRERRTARPVEDMPAPPIVYGNYSQLRGLVNEERAVSSVLRNAAPTEERPS